MGVPVVTLPGRRPVSRQTLSILGAFHRTEFVASTEDEYVAIASDLAGAPERLTDLRSRLRSEMAASRLCDAKAFALDLEQVYQSII
jgi:predicted O-linked N-acetylglucosamine transferase (SPINDLY family)